MTPPRAPDPVSAGDAAGAAYVGLCEEIAETQGVINLAEARLVSLTRRALEMGVSGGTNLPDKAWLAWRAGISPERAGAIVKVAERSSELPHTMAALGAGELTVDQAAVIARHVPVRYDESAANVARFCTVRQLRQALPHYRDRRPDKPEPGSDADVEAHGSVSARTDETGYHLHLHLPDVAKGAIVDQALKAMHEDLKRQARADTPEGCDPQPVYATDALIALAETALQAGEAARPGSERYLVVVHLEAGANGIELMTHLGIAVPDGERRHILCDSRLQALVHDGTTPLGCGRTTRTINRKLRRAIEHRDHGCSVPGCGRSTGLEVHHIWHWEDGGPTETWNLIALCAHHHRCHHRGTLGIAGNADLPRHAEPGVVFTDGWGHPLDPVGQPITPTRRGAGQTAAQHLTDTARAAGTGTHTYIPPTGERLDRWGFHLCEADPPDTDPPGTDEDGDPPPPAVTGQRTGTAHPTPPDPRAAPPPTPPGPAPTPSESPSQTPGTLCPQPGARGRPHRS